MSEQQHHADEPRHADDRYARESFSMRGMKRWQVWAITAVSALIVIGLLIYTV